MTDHFLLEARLLLRNRFFIVMGATLIALAMFAGYGGGQLAREQAAAIETAMTLEASHDAEAVEKARRIKAGEIEPPWWQSPLNAQGWSYSLIRHVSLPPRPLAGVAVADADIQPFLFRINPHPPDRWSNRASELTPSVAAYGGLDLTDVLLILTPLIVVVSFADVIRDRDGSERQQLATVQASSERRLVFARLLPRSVIVLLLVLAGAVCGLAATLPPSDASVLWDAGGVLAVFLAHTLFWIGLAFAMTLAMRRAVGIFALFVSAWFILGIMSPAIVEGAARITAPPPSPLDVFASERAEIVRARMKEEDLTRAYAERDPLARDMLLEALAKDQLLITPTNLLVQREIDGRRGEARDQERLARRRFVDEAQRASSFSPTLAARNAIYVLAGRDYKRRADFNEQTNAYHRKLQEVFTPLLMRRAVLDEVLLPTPFVFDETSETN